MDSNAPRSLVEPPAASPSRRLHGVSSEVSVVWDRGFTHSERGHRAPRPRPRTGRHGPDHGERYRPQQDVTDSVLS
jgi:hypothetical protein